MVDIYSKEMLYVGGTEKEFVRPNLMLNGTMGGNAFAVTTSVNTSFAYKLCDGAASDTTSWTMRGDGQIQNFIFYNPKPLKVSFVQFNGNTTITAYLTNINIFGSNDNSNWTSITNSCVISRTSAKCTLTNEKFYKYYKFEFVATTLWVSISFNNLAITATYKG